ncbi:MAG: hypothetical protein WD716_00840 [Fimbriimonadaceae bacterium]
MSLDDAASLTDYLPISFQSPKEQEYVAFLWDAFEANYETGKYQFAFLAYHMLTMSFVYFEIWQIRQTRPKDFAMAMVGFNKDLEQELLEATSPFTFWRVNESSVVRFLKLIGCDNGKVGTYAALVKQRNDTAHPNGNIFFSTQDALDAKIGEVLRVVEEIQSHSTPVVEDCYRDFLMQSAESDAREYPDAGDEVREALVHRHYLSQRDIDVCLEMDLAPVAVGPAAAGVGELDAALRSAYGPSGA